MAADLDRWLKHVFYPLVIPTNFCTETGIQRFIAGFGTQVLVPVPGGLVELSAPGNISLNMLSVRRMLEEDLGLEKFALDVHKHFIKQLVEKAKTPNQPQE